MQSPLSSGDMRRCTQGSCANAHCAGKRKRPQLSRNFIAYRHASAGTREHHHSSKTLVVGELSGQQLASLAAIVQSFVHPSEAASSVNNVQSPYLEGCVELQGTLRPLE